MKTAVLSGAHSHQNFMAITNMAAPKSVCMRLALVTTIESRNANRHCEIRIIGQHPQFDAIAHRLDDLGISGGRYRALLFTVNFKDFSNLKNNTVNFKDFF
jgi:hypothetical protein